MNEEAVAGLKAQIEDYKDFLNGQQKLFRASITEDQNYYMGKIEGFDVAKTMLNDLLIFIKDN